MDNTQHFPRPRHGAVQSKRGTVHYWITRADPGAPVLVLTHGLTADHTMFDPQVEAFAGKYTVLTWDVPLHGLSRPYRSFSHHNAAEELWTILENEGITRAVFGGMSMGGYPTQMLALAHPEAVAGFIGLGTTPFGHDYYTKSDYFWLRRVGPLSKLYGDKGLRKAMAANASGTESGRQRMMDMMAPFTKNELIAQLTACYNCFTAENRNVSFAFPMVLLVGEKDKTGKVLAYNKAWAAKTGAPLHLIPHTAHLLNWDAPEEVNREIAAFTDRVWQNEEKA